MVSSILHVAVIGFHHKRGCQREFHLNDNALRGIFNAHRLNLNKKRINVEYCYPPLAGNGELPIPWQNLPSLALPDGAHNVDNDVIYFLLPALEDPNRSVFGISCYRQIAAKDLLNKSTDVTRSTVQKSVCVLSQVPLFGVLTAKLQLITAAYFNERDFAKVDVLSQMYENLCEIFSYENIDDEAAVMDISVQSLIKTFKHRVLVLFKLLLLEKKVVFFISPVFQLSQLMVALISLYPRLVEEGLYQAAAYNKNVPGHADMDAIANENQAAVEMASDVVDDELSDHKSYEKSNYNTQGSSFANDDVESDGEGPSKLNKEDDNEKHSSSACVETSTNLQPKKMLDTDSYGFPLSIFTKGSLFHPYLSISYLDMIRSEKTRAYCIGATNALFIQRRDLLDAVVTVDENGDGNIDIVNVALRRALTVTAADLRFADFVLKEVEANIKSPRWEGGDGWIRLQMRAYLLSLISTARADLKGALSDFNEAFIAEWRLSNNYRIWSSGNYPDLASSVPGHPFAGGLGVSDVLLRMEHSVGGTESGRRVASAFASTGKYFSDTGSKVKTSIASWLKGSM